MSEINCIFCKIANREAQAKIVHETDNFIAFENIHPAAPIHILVIPKEHIEKIDAMKNADSSAFWSKLIGFGYEVIKKMGLDTTGYRLVNNGAGFHGINHEHIHILGGKDWRPNDSL
jgi:histidine triad (HIT) family protein